MNETTALPADDLGLLLGSMHEAAAGITSTKIGPGHYRVILWPEADPIAGHGTTPAEAMANAYRALMRRLGEDNTDTDVEAEADDAEAGQQPGVRHTADRSPIAPWANFAERIAEVHRLTDALARAVAELAIHSATVAPTSTTAPNLADLLDDLGCTVTQSEIVDGPRRGQHIATIAESDGDEHTGVGVTPAAALTAAAEKLAAQQAGGTRHIVTIGDVRTYQGTIPSLQGRTVVVFFLRPARHLCYVRPLDDLDAVFNVDERDLADAVTAAEQAVTS